MSHINVNDWRNKRKDGLEVLRFRLKAYAEDFEVREQPLSGTACGFDEQEDLIDTTKVDSIVRKALGATESCLVPQSLASNERKETTYDLSLFLTTRLMDELECMHESFINSLSCEKAQFNSKPLTLTLPQTLDKANRQKIHEVIHERFPLLHTSKSNRKSSEGGNKDCLQYEVTIDSNLRALLNAHCSLTDVKEISKFLRHQNLENFSKSLVFGTGFG